MNLRKSHTWIALVLSPLAILAGWIALRAHGAETGPDVVAHTLRSLTVGWLVSPEEPVHDRLGAEQADFWLRETARMLEQMPDTAEAAMGAAWLLDTPSAGLMQRFLGPPESPKSLWHVRELSSPSMDYDGLAREEDQFESRCGEACLAQAERATRLDPGDVRWWRMRAMLQFRWRFFGTNEPRHPDWLAVLDEAARHDPDNALYDYLAAVQFWRSSAEYEFRFDREVRQKEPWYELNVFDQEGFAEGERRFEQGLRKEFLAHGETGWPAVAAVLEYSRLPRTQQLQVARSRALSSRISFDLVSLFRWQSVRADVRRQAGEVQAAATLLKQIHAIIDQVEAGGEMMALVNVTYPFRWSAAAQLRSLHETYPDAVTEAELEPFQARSHTSRLELAVLESANQKWIDERMEDRSMPLVRGAIMGTAMNLVAPLAILGLLAWLGGWLLQPQAPRLPIGMFWHPLAWVVGFGLTFLLLVFLVPDRWLSTRTFGTPFDQWQYEAVQTVIQTGLNAQQGSWYLAVLRWSAGFGPYVGAVTSLLLVAGAYTVIRWKSTGLHRMDTARSIAESEGGRSLDSSETGAAEAGTALSPSRCWWAGLAQCMGHSQLAMAYGLLLLTLFLLPVMIQSSEAYYQRNMAWIRAPEAVWSEIGNEIQRIEADPQQMKLLREEVEAEVATQEALP